MIRLLISLIVTRTNRINRILLVGLHHRIVKGLQLITLYYTELSGKSVPVNYRIYDKQEGKTKNDYFREMIAEVLAWDYSQRW